MTMKTTLQFFSVLTAFVCTMTANAQWVQQSSGTSQNLGAIDCWNFQHCFAVGLNGTTRKTNNGGTTWVASNSFTIASMTSAKMLDTLTILLGKVNGNFHYSTNGGSTWTPVFGGNSNYILADIKFVNDSVGYSVGGSLIYSNSGQIITKTTNGGTAWTPQINVSNQSTLLGIDCINDSTCIAVGGTKLILRTTDGGANWTTINSDTALHSFYDVHFPSANIGYAVGGTVTNPTTVSFIYKTINGGINWTPLTSPTTNSLYGCFFTSIDTGYVVGNAASIYKTTDGGISWTQQTSPVTIELNKIYFTDSNTGYIVGNNGTILKTTNGGTSSLQEISSQKFSTKVFPNPFSTVTTLQTDIILKSATLTIYNLYGQTVKQIKNISGQTVTLFRDNLSSGLYFIRLTQDNKIISADKLVITDN